jgi:Protein of unknown function (DUF1549)/Protein of unknown function (DUF1553)
MRPASLLILLATIGFSVAGNLKVVVAGHWSLAPRSQPKIPVCADPEAAKWVRNPIDAFILERLTRAGLKPAPEADRQTLIRRVTFDLTGLPPTPEEITSFVNDPSPDAYEKLVERLLASSHYGERWGRHWLDVVRFAETEGFEYDRPRAGAWRYRDYVIKAFNDDKPFDRFLREQLAGDEVDPGNHECLAAAGFHRLGPVRRNAGNKNVAFSRNEVLTEMTDAIGASFLGLTMGCARCHDHKFDDITQADYYSLQAFLAPIQEHDLILADAKTEAEWKERTEKIQQQVKQLQTELKGKEGDARKKLEQKVEELGRTLPEPLPTISTVSNSDKERTPIHILKRGDMDRKGPLVRPRALSVLLPKGATEIPADVKNPRTLLANWLNEPEHPLTARVLVNRVWHYHFGRGIVATPNDFGGNGSPPSHSELLDYLANTFIANGRRIKPLQRLILQSNSYRQASTASDIARSQRLDPEDRLLHRFPRRRLAAEEVRDAMLAVAGKLNRKAGGPSVIVPVDPDLVSLLYNSSQWTVTPNKEEHDRRSVYLLAKRNLQLPFAQAFDQPDTQTSCPRRESSTHALQALELLNGDLSNRLAQAFAERLVHDCGPDHGKQVERAFVLTTGRPPTPKERQFALAFLESQKLKEFALTMFNLNAFLYVN